MDFRSTDISKIKDEFPQKRDCLSKIVNYLRSENQKRICGVFGLKRTGKTTLMKQAALSIPDEERKKSVFITCEKESNFRRIVEFLRESIASGKKYFFIDEITLTDKFQILAEVLSDNLVDLKNARIVVSGTESLGLSLASHSSLYDRIEIVHTTYMPFAEFARIRGNSSIDHYIKHGCALSKQNPFETKQSTKEYIESCIVDNFIKSVEKSDKGPHCYPLDLKNPCKRKEAENAIRTIINFYIQNIGLDDFYNSYSERIYETVHKLLKEMDVILELPIETLRVNLDNPKENKSCHRLEVLSNPGMYFASLNNSRERAYEKILEQFVIADAFKMLEKKGDYCEDLGYTKLYRWRVARVLAKSKGYEDIAILIICDRKEKKTFAFEINHSGQLETKPLADCIEENFGKIAFSATLCDGKCDMDSKTTALDISYFLIDIYNNSNDSGYSIEDTITRFAH